MQTEMLAVKGMTCSHCQSSVEGSLKGLDGVSSVDVNLESGKVEVNFDEAKVSLEKLKEAVEDQGYDVA